MPYSGYYPIAATETLTDTTQNRHVFQSPINPTTPFTASQHEGRVRLWSFHNQAFPEISQIDFDNAFGVRMNLFAPMDRRRRRLPLSVLPHGPFQYSSGYEWAINGHLWGVAATLPAFGNPEVRYMYRIVIQTSIICTNNNLRVTPYWCALRQVQTNSIQNPGLREYQLLSRLSLQWQGKYVSLNSFLLEGDLNNVYRDRLGPRINKNPPEIHYGVALILESRDTRIDGFSGRITLERLEGPDYGINTRAF